MKKKDVQTLHLRITFTMNMYFLIFDAYIEYALQL